MLQNHATLHQARFYLLKELRKRYSENESTSITRLILEYIAYPLSLCLREPDKITPSRVITQINHIVAEIHTDRPIQYILGSVQFCDLNIKVNESVLIPRPETEEMVQTILSAHGPKYRKIIDLGTGSGCIALALKHHFPEALVSGLDVSRDALSIARQNASLNMLSVNWLEGDLLNRSMLEESMDQSSGFDLVASNPPYVMDSEKNLMEARVLFYEPGRALFVKDQDPLLYYRAILGFCDTYLLKGGHLWVEINEKLGMETAALFDKAGYQLIQIKKDIHEKERFIHARK